jgi:hypothetical protein
MAPTALALLKDLVAVLSSMEHCRFCCIAADEACHDVAFAGALKRAKAFLKAERLAAEQKPS